MNHSRMVMAHAIAQATLKMECLTNTSSSGFNGTDIDTWETARTTVPVISLLTRPLAPAMVWCDYGNTDIEISMHISGWPHTYLVSRIRASLYDLHSYQMVPVTDFRLVHTLRVSLTNFHAEYDSDDVIQAFQTYVQHNDWLTGRIQ